ncbi:MAG: patatin-like phospholipase family protein [Desulfuromonadales bacterium]|jgi:NTE family protein
MYGTRFSPSLSFISATTRLVNGERLINNIGKPRHILVRASLALCLIIQLAGCASNATVVNNPLAQQAPESSYSLQAFTERFRRGETSFLLAFSGGGTRAAALSYGVLKALNDTFVETQSGPRPLIDSVDLISSVSGGSFTSAYYGLYGEQIFDKFESDFLRKNVQGALINRLVNPFNWFHIGDRTEWAINYYDQNVFKGARFSDLQKAGGPLIFINASDIEGGVGFWFTQDHFDLLCSDLSNFPVARAVAASSAVPGLFAPVVLQNFDDCQTENRQLIERAQAVAAQRPELKLELAGLESYADKERRLYIHLVDGGITDNLGLRGIYAINQLSGGLASRLKQRDIEPPRRIVVLSVDASTEPEYEMSRSKQVPPISEVISAISGVQLHRYNAATNSLIERALLEWRDELSAEGHTPETYYIRLDLGQETDPQKRDFLNRIPTSFSLTDEQVDVLIETGGALLRSNPEFRRLAVDAGLTL